MLMYVCCRQSLGKLELNYWKGIDKTLRMNRKGNEFLLNRTLGCCSVVTIFICLLFV